MDTHNDANCNQEQVRRSGRCRTVNSIYADSIGQLKKTNRKPITIKKPTHKSSLIENQESDDYQIRGNADKEYIESYCKAEIQLQDGTTQIIHVFIQVPKKVERRSTRVIKQPSQTKRVVTPPPTMIKRKTSAFKTSTKQIPKQEPTSLLNIILNAAMKIQEQPHLDQQQNSQRISNSMQIQDQMNNSIERSSQKRPFESRQRIKGFQKDESNRKLAKMELKFHNIKKRYQQIRPKLMSSLLQL